jgi:hypothetical protein
LHTSFEMPLPGNINAVDRFQRAAYYSALLPEPVDERRAVAGVMAIIRNVSVPFGAPYAEFGVYTSGEMKNLPEFEGGKGEKDRLGGFDAVRIGGGYVKDDTKLFVAQKTVVIPSPNGLFVLQLNAKGAEDRADVLPWTPSTKRPPSRRDQPSSHGTARRPQLGDSIPACPSIAAIHSPATPFSGCWALAGWARCTWRSTRG